MTASQNMIGSEKASAVRAIAAYAVFAIVAVLATLPTAWEMARIWAGSSSYHHGFFVAPAAIWMIVTRSGWPSETTRRRLGLTLVAGGALLWLAGHAGSAAIVSQAGLITVLIGGVGVVFSDRALTHWAYPLAFLYFMIPFGESIVPALQLGTAQVVVALLSLLGFEVSIEGVLIHTAVGTFAIAQACAGLRLLIAALMISAIFAYAAFSKWSKRIAFLIFAAAFSIFTNGIRAFILVLIPLVSGGDAHIGPDHFIIGWFLYLAVLIILILTGRHFADQRTSYAHRAAPPFVQLLVIAGAAAIIVAFGTYGHFLVDRKINRTLPASATLISAPGWRLLPPPENWSPHFNNPDRTASATYQKNAERVYVAFAEYAFDRRGAEIASGTNRAWDSTDWDRAGTHRDVIYLFGFSQNRDFDILAGPENRRLLALTAYWLGDELYFNRRDVKLKQAKLKLLGKNPAGGVIVLTASFTKDPEEALRVLRHYTGDIESFDDWRNDEPGD